MPAAALLASSTGVVAFVSPIFIAESDFIESIFIESAGMDDDVVDAGAGVTTGAGAGAGAGAGVGAGGGAGSFLPQAASATTIIEASNSDLFILEKSFMVIR